jgi:cytochrome c
MKSTAKFVTALLAVGVLGLLPAQAEGDATAGRNLFARCSACHDATTDKNKVGPSLMTVVGRKAGSLESFQAKYSDAMKAAGAGGLVWDEANLAEYIKAPKTKVPDNNMAFSGLKDDVAVANIIAYLKADPKP